MLRDQRVLRGVGDDMGPMCLVAWSTGRSGPGVLEGVAGSSAHPASA
jgi:hypothetical protein